MTPEQLVEIPGIGEKMVEKIHQSVAAYFEALETAAAAAPEGAVAAEGGEPAAEPEAAAQPKRLRSSTKPPRRRPKQIAASEAGETGESGESGEVAHAGDQSS